MTSSASHRNQSSLVRTTRSVLTLLLLISALSVLLTACGSDSHYRAQAEQNKQAFEKELQHASDIGVPDTYLKSIQKQKDALNNTFAPLTLFSLNGQAVDQYYNNLATRYKQLTLQTQGVVPVATQQLQNQASKDLESWQRLLGQQNSKGLPVDTLKANYTASQEKLKTAKLPKDYNAIIAEANTGMKTLNMLGDTAEKLNSFKETIDLMADGKLDVTTYQQKYQTNKDAMGKAASPQDLQKINQQIDADYQQAATQFKSSIPIITQAKIKDLETRLDKLKQNKVETSSYQSQFDALKSMQQTTKTVDEYNAFAKKASALQDAMKFDLLKVDTKLLLDQYHREVEEYGKKYTYFNAPDGQTYALNFEYEQRGLGEDLDKAYNNATTYEEMQQAYTDISNGIFHQRMLGEDYSDKTPYNQPHETDRKLLERYKLQNDLVIVVSFVEQALRIYQNGKVIYAIPIVSGRTELPAVPGIWKPLLRDTNMVFKSPFPKGSPYWYEDTPINYGILYHDGGYFLHDSPWRLDYGPGKQFPHTDSGGAASASSGTHGCINMPTEQMRWIYEHTDYNTPIIMY
uniref:L,D-TPase catalytic domain-containing protein n=1 Tax=Thermosporothrix sp. COM3 TaxID=2490863 RepID=A0A455SNN8_9CHLR|nr:hypothetical protein KTC_47680 [Thermosporothrix sp. COM3]